MDNHKHYDYFYHGALDIRGGVYVVYSHPQPLFHSCRRGRGEPRNIFNYFKIVPSPSTAVVGEGQGEGKKVREKKNGSSLDELPRFMRLQETIYLSLKVLKRTIVYNSTFFIFHFSPPLLFNLFFLLFFIVCNK